MHRPFKSPRKIGPSPRSDLRESESPHSSSSVAKTNTHLANSIDPGSQAAGPKTSQGQIIKRFKASSSAGINSLPPEDFQKVLHLLNPKELLNSASVNQDWEAATNAIYKQQGRPYTAELKKLAAEEKLLFFTLKSTCDTDRKRLYCLLSYDLISKQDDDDWFHRILYIDNFSFNSHSSVIIESYLLQGFWTLFMMACSKWHSELLVTEFIQEIIKRQRNNIQRSAIKIIPREMGKEYNGGFTLLHFCSVWQKSELMQELIEAGRDIFGYGINDRAYSKYSPLFCCLASAVCRVLKGYEQYIWGSEAEPPSWSGMPGIDVLSWMPALEEIKIYVKMGARLDDIFETKEEAFKEVRLMPSSLGNGFEQYFGKSRAYTLLQGMKALKMLLDSDIRDRKRNKQLPEDELALVIQKRDLVFDIMSFLCYSYAKTNNNLEDILRMHNYTDEDIKALTKNGEKYAEGTTLSHVSSNNFNC